LRRTFYEATILLQNMDRAIVLRSMLLLFFWLQNFIPCWSFLGNPSFSPNQIVRTLSTSFNGNSVRNLKTSKPLISNLNSFKLFASPDTNVNVDQEIKDSPDATQIKSTKDEMEGDDSLMSQNLRNIFQADRLLSPEALEKNNEINECILKLEKTNPTQNITTNDSLAGTWELAYTTQTQGGMLGIQVLAWISSQSRGIFNLKGVQIAFQKNEARGKWVEGQWFLEATVGISLLSGEQDVTVKTFLIPENKNTFVETYLGVEAGPLQLPLPRLFPYRRRINLTYLDADILVGRDDTGAVDVLVKKEK